MDARLISFTAAALALGAAVITFVRADAGEDVMLRVIGLAAAGIVLIAFGLRQPRVDA